MYSPSVAKKVLEVWSVQFEDDIDENRPDPGRGDAPDKAPDTPTNEPKPAPVQDPPAEPGRRPYVVAAGPHGTGNQ
jgi:hypothetical protein